MVMHNILGNLDNVWNYQIIYDSSFFQNGCPDLGKILTCSEYGYTEWKGWVFMTEDKTSSFWHHDDCLISWSKSGKFSRDAKRNSLRVITICACT
jgi:hypothetical protein